MIDNVQIQLTPKYFDGDRPSWLTGFLREEVRVPKALLLLRFWHKQSGIRFFVHEKSGRV